MTYRPAPGLSPWMLLSVLAVTAPADAAVQASVDNDRIAPADTLQLTIHRDGQTNGRPDLSPLQQDFDILSTRSSTSIQIINGSTSAGTEVIAALSPKHDGRITIPPISWDGDRSQPVTVTVDPQAGGGNNGSSQTTRSPDVFLETTVDEKQPYVQAEVPVTVRIYTTQTLYHPSLELPAGNDTLVQQVGSDERSQTEKNGRMYNVLTRHYAIFPQRSGHVQLTAPVLQAEVADRLDRSGNDPFSSLFGNSPFGSMLTQTKPIRVHGQAVELDVRPRPPDIAANYWLPAQDLQINSDWRPQSLQVRAGDPATLQLHLRAVGLTAEQLPDLTRLLDLPAGLKEYPDEAKLSNAAKGVDVVGSRDQSVALIADQPGRFTIPPLTVRWWDTQGKEMRTVSLPSRTIEVLPGTAAVAARASTEPSQNSARPARAQNAPLAPAARETGSTALTGGELMWRLLAVASFVLWVLTIAVWLLRRRRTQRAPEAVAQSERSSAPGATEARSAFREACQANDARAARRHLLEWLAAVQPQKPQQGLNALARGAGDAALSTLLRDLDRACYVGGEWSGAALAAALEKLPANLQPASDPNRTQGLAPLYP
jgi:hypothetical protein